MPDLTKFQQRILDIAVDIAARGRYPTVRLIRSRLSRDDRTSETPIFRARAELIRLKLWPVDHRRALAAKTRCPTGQFETLYPENLPSIDRTNERPTKNRRKPLGPFRRDIALSARLLRKFRAWLAQKESDVETSL